MKLPTREDDLPDYLKARAKEINEERPNMEKGAAYVNGFHDGMNYTMSVVMKRSQDKAKKLLEEAGW